MLSGWEIQDLGNLEWEYCLHMYTQTHGTVPLWSTSQVTDNGTTPLHFASHEGHLAVVRLLLEAGVAKDVSNAHGATALHLAARRGHLEVVKVLLDFGAQQLAVSTPLKHVSLFSIPQTER